VLRPVESNSRLLRKLSDESLASPKKQRERRVRSGITDTDVGKRNGLLYAKSLARSVVNKQVQKSRINVVGEVEARGASQRPRSHEREQREEQVLEVDADEEAETSLWCGEEEAEAQEEAVAPVQVISDEEDDEPVVDARSRRRQPQSRRVISDSDEEEEEDEGGVSDPQPVNHFRHPSFQIPDLKPVQLPAQEPANLISMRPPHRQGHSMISNWAQEVIDLTDAPEAPASFVLPPPTHARSGSFAASSRPTSSESNAPLAVLTYSPTPTKQRSPYKAPPLSRPATPPLAPPSPSKLVSPSKKKPAIPKATDLDGRPSLDAFWNPAAVNEWTDRHSPVKSKPVVSPKKQKWREDIVKMMEGVALEDSSDEGYESPTTSPRKPVSRNPIKKKSPNPGVEAAPNVKQLREQRKAFAERKHAIAEAFLIELDSTISGGRIMQLSKPTGGIKLVWSKTLKTTAGRANWRREQIRIRTGALPSDTKAEIRHHCSIELAEKVIDDEERLYNVLAHEFCHLTTFMISEVRNNPHGADFKAWGRKATNAFQSKGVEVTTKHSYQIEYKYVWECVACGYEFKRHSKSIDTARHSCGRCKGKLAQTKPTPRGVGAGAVVGKDGKREKSEYQVFVKANFGRVKKELEREGRDAQMGKVMEAVAKEYREMKEKKGVKEVIDLEEALEGMKI
jgi:predicted SprT family Zn-dependent metalloprotease